MGDRFREYLSWYFPELWVVCTSHGTRSKAGGLTLTSAGRASWSLEFQLCSSLEKEFNRYNTAVENLKEWVLATKIGSTQGAQRMTDAREEYLEAAATLHKMPEDFNAWISRWDGLASYAGRGRKAMEAPMANESAHASSVERSSSESVTKKQIDSERASFEEKITNLVPPEKIEVMGVLMERW
ncbi:uncharacterized protein BCR38DRAFT_524367 [Pseudomassariella vexata]|uniref:Uncharacterized protein n=1 Tax=Pseudomassariella vexata TaxID=1141098 RepID=A0A1Y2DYW9_9PEZI|nr:uncharacterized protein BCR38DRAFT_524367 [Pseudomassariella vexata]ORY64284.1 hypothetical protein BCR38DRAFT_524367 [Pseudomassariella vexata]